MAHNFYRPKSSVPPRNRGFTLIELLITVVIVAIMLAVAAPSFTALINSNAIASQTNYFSSAIGTARSEAITRNTPVIMCKRNNLTCSNGVQWENGWIIFADNDGDDALDSGEELRYMDALRNDYTLRPSTATLNWLRFQPDGKVSSNLTTFSGVTFRLCAPDADTTESRAISFNFVGQARLAKGTASCP